MNVFKGTKNVIFLIILVLSSCATPKKGACPSFDSAKAKNFKNRARHFNVQAVFSLNKREKYKNKKSFNSNDKAEQFTAYDMIDLNAFALNESETPVILETSPIYSMPLPTPNPSENNNSTAHKKRIKKLNKTKNMNTLNQENKEFSVFFNNAIYNGNPQKAERENARIIGGALLLMAVLAGIAIPALGTLTASLGLIGIFLLDILVSIGIYKYHKKEKPKLAKASSILRLVYTAILGVGISYHIMGNVPMFNKIWGVGLIAFGIHLISLGILFNNNGGKKWVNIMIKSLLIIAGIGYIIQYTGILLVPNPVGFAALIESIFIIPMILGEVFYALWMLIKGGKSRKLEN